VEEPTAVYAHMSCLAARYGLSRELKKEFDNRFKEAIQHAPTSATAGRLARFLLMLRGNQINFTGRATLERLFVKSLKRSRRITWQAADVEAVCEFLSKFSRDVALRRRLLITAIEQFPDSAQLHLLAGELEMESGPFSCNYKQARHHMERAVKLVRMPGRQQDETIVERAQRALALLGQGGLGFPPVGMFGDDEDDWYDEDDDEESYFGESEEYNSRSDMGGDRIPEVGKRTTPQQFLEELNRSMPPELLQMFEREARSIGMTPEEVLLGAMEGLPIPDPERSGATKSSRRRKRRKT
jgi:hypothetical protein